MFRSPAVRFFSSQLSKLHPERVLAVRTVPVQRRSQSVGASRKDVSQIKDEPKMFCFQCEQTKNRTGCVEIGVCGKTPQVAKLQDLTVYLVKGLAIYADRLYKLGAEVPQDAVDLVTHALFCTVTNVNFDSSRFHSLINDIIASRDQLREQYEFECSEKGIEQEKFPTDAVTYQLPEGKNTTVETMELEAEKVGQLVELKNYGESVRGVREMAVYGLKGTLAYYSHANRLGKRDASVEKGSIEILSFLESGDETLRHDLGHNLGLALKVGEINLTTMALLDQGHRDIMGTPEPTVVPITPKEGKAMLVSGHDLKDMEKILKYTEGKGINVYTHGEMLPAHSYPKLKKYKHFVGHYGGGWQLQQFEFPDFPGPIIITSNCIIEPRKAYENRIYTLNSVGWPGVEHLDIDDEKAFQSIITQAQNDRGYIEADEKRVPEKTITVGFGHEAVLGVADQVLDAAKSGALKHIFLVGGCDGSENRRSYFTTLVDKAPDDTLILTMGCAKYRFNRARDYGFLGESEIPRLLDMGQCNDAYGAVKVALALADALKTDVNSLPLSLCISWFEQKAVAVLLSLLHLGIRNIRVGPIAPAFISEEVLGILEEKFNLLPTDLRARKKRDPEDDLNAMLGKG